MRNVALDLGVHKTSYCEVSQGCVIERATMRDVGELVRWLGPGTATARVALEACREAWFVHRQLREWGHEPWLVDTTRARRLGVAQHGRKTDRIDAEVLARALEAGQIPLAHVLSPERQELRHELAVRAALVETRAQYVTTVRGLLRAHGVQAPGCATENFVRAVRKLAPEAALWTLVEPLLLVLESIGPRIETADRRLLELCNQDATLARLMTLPGAGLVVVASFAAVVDDAKRFRHAHQVESYFGLVPSESTTGGKRRLGSITKHGNRYGRVMLVQAAHRLLARGPDDDPLKLWALGVAERRGTRIAVIALARRIVGVLWAMWRDGTVYEPTRVGMASAAGLRRSARETGRQADSIQQAALAHVAKKLRRRRGLRKTSEVGTV